MGCKHGRVRQAKTVAMIVAEPCTLCMLAAAWQRGERAASQSRSTCQEPLHQMWHRKAAMTLEKHAA